MFSWMKVLALSCLAVLAPVKALMLAAGFLIFLDLATGLYRAHKAGEKITSAALRRTVTKVFVYQTAIVTALVIQSYFLPEMGVVKLVAAVIGLVEGKSILENLEAVNGQPIFRALINKLGSDNDKKLQ